MTGARATGAPFLHNVQSLPEKCDSTLIATHSPILLSYPGAVLFSLDGETIEEIGYRDTKHYVITRDFLNSPERFFKHLFGATDDEGT